MTKLIVVERPGESGNINECPYRYDRALKNKYRKCEHPSKIHDSSLICPDPDTFPETCPLIDQAKYEHDSTKANAHWVYICQLDGKFKNWHIVFGDDGKLMDVYED